MRAYVLAFALIVPSACATQSYLPERSTVAYSGSADHDHHDDDDDDVPVTAAELASLTPQASRIVILQTKELDRPAEVIGVVDAHEAMGHHDAALLTLRKKAAALGADAVIGVEFHHGEGEGEPTHLSGLAVRFLSRPPFRPQL